MNYRLIALFVLFYTSSFSQEQKITARIVDAGTQTAIKYANITIPGTNLRTFTNHLGYFELAVDRTKHTHLLISHISYKILQIALPAEDRFKVPLEKDTVLLNTLNLTLYPKTSTGSTEIVHDSLASESEASFPGGIEAFYTYVGNALAPALPDLTDQGFSVLFTINETGQPSDITVSDPSASAVINEAFQKMPAWTAASQRQKKVKQVFSLSVNRFIKVVLQPADINDITTFIQRQVKYPAQAKRMGVEGAIFMQFAVDESGNVMSIVVLKGINDYCNDEVKRVISIVPAAYLKSLVDKTRQREFILPVFFGLDKALRTGRGYVPNSSAYMLTAIDVVAGGLIIQRRELGNGAARTVYGSFPKPEPVLTTFTTLGEALLLPKNVQRLSLRNNGLSAFPIDILKLPSLNFLDLENNQLTALPDDINVLTDLKELYLLNNKLTVLPSNFSSLKKLRTLSLANNKFGSFPQSVTSLEKLEILDLSSNQLNSIPSEIGLMKNLKTLVLINNKITSLPPEFFTLKKLEKIYLDGNPINSNDLELFKKTFSKAEIGF